MKKMILIFIILFQTFLFLLYPTHTLEASKQGLLLWFYQILPTLLPWTILSNILINSNFFARNTSSENHSSTSLEALILVCGYFFGFPIGSKLTADFYQAGLLQKKRAQILCACSNQFSFTYINTLVISQVLALSNHQAVYFAILYLPGLLLGLCLLFLDHHKKKKPTHQNTSYDTKKTASRFQMDMQIIDAGIISGFEALIKLCGYIVMFSILVSGFQILLGQHTLLLIFCNNLLETTSGIGTLPNYNLTLAEKYITTIMALNWGGLSCIAQTNSILSHTDLSIKFYLKYKLLCTACSTLLTIPVLFILGIR